MSAPKLREAELLDLAKSWFEDARQKSAKEEAEFRAWNKERLKFTQGGDGFFSFGDSSDGGCGD